MKRSLRRMLCRHRFARWLIITGFISASPAGLADPQTLAFIDASDNSPLEGVVVIASDSPALTAASSGPAAITQINRQFQPHVSIVPAGTQVEFPNLDNTQHHVYSFSPAKTFELKLYASQPEAPVLFDTEGVVELGCNIHDQMQGFVVVIGAGQAVTSDSQGRVELPQATNDQPQRNLSVWHPRLADNSRPLPLTMSSGTPQTIPLTLQPPVEPVSRLDRLQQRYMDIE